MKHKVVNYTSVKNASKYEAERLHKNPTLKNTVCESLANFFGNTKEAIADHPYLTEFIGLAVLSTATSLAVGGIITIPEMTPDEQVRAFLLYSGGVAVADAAMAVPCKIEGTFARPLYKFCENMEQRFLDGAYQGQEEVLDKQYGNEDMQGEEIQNSQPHQFKVYTLDPEEWEK